MRSLRLSDSATLAVLCLGTLMLCCRAHRDVLRIELPANYTGPIQVECGVYGRDLPVVQVDATGHGKAAVCSREAMDVQVSRQGQILTVEPEWLTTGDGLPNVVRFSVR